MKHFILFVSFFAIFLSCDTEKDAITASQFVGNWELSLREFSGCNNPDENGVNTRWKTYSLNLNADGTGHQIAIEQNAPEGHENRYDFEYKIDGNTLMIRDIEDTEYYNGGDLSIVGEQLVLTYENTYSGCTEVTTFNK